MRLDQCPRWRIEIVRFFFCSSVARGIIFRPSAAPFFVLLATPSGSLRSRAGGRILVVRSSIVRVYPGGSAIAHTSLASFELPCRCIGSNKKKKKKIVRFITACRVDLSGERTPACFGLDRTDSIEQWSPTDDRLTRSIDHHSVEHGEPMSVLRSKSFGSNGTGHMFGHS